METPEQRPIEEQMKKEMEDQMQENIRRDFHFFCGLFAMEVIFSSHPDRHRFIDEFFIQWRKRIRRIIDLGIKNNEKNRNPDFEKFCSAILPPQMQGAFKMPNPEDTRVKANKILAELEKEFRTYFEQCMDLADDEEGESWKKGK